MPVKDVASTPKQIKSWSPTRLIEFEQCAYRAKLKIIDKVPEPERPLPEGKTEHANDRGTRIHDECEQYVRGDKDDTPKEAHKFEAELKSLRKRYTEGKVELEGEWGFDKNWEPCDYKTAWLRLKCDAIVHLTSTHLLVVDYKTGRKFGNEIKHGEQLQMYALAAAIKFPNVETIDVELWYFDQKDGENYTHETKSAAKWKYHQKFFSNRGLKMTNETKFLPNPNALSCRWCPYKDGICEYAVTTTIAPRRKKTY